MESLSVEKSSKSLSEIIFDIGKYVSEVENDNKRLKERVTELEGCDPSWRILDSLPDVLVAQDIADYMHISRNKVYDLFKLPVEKGGIVCLDSGRSVRCLKADFIDWIRKRKAK